MSHPEQSPQMRAAKGNCLEMLRLILDGEASEEDKKDFIDKHLEICMPCYKTITWKWRSGIC